MKKVLTALICLILLVALTLPAAAAPEVVFTADSRFAPGGTVTVDIMAMTDMDSTIYAAWLEGDVVYHWYVDGEENPELNGKSITLWQEFKGHTIHVEVVCYDMTVTSQRHLIMDTVVTQPTTAPTVPTNPTIQVDPCADGHDFENGVCRNCFAQDPDYIVPTSQPQMADTQPAVPQPNPNQNRNPISDSSANSTISLLFILVLILGILLSMVVVGGIVVLIIVLVKKKK